MLRNNPAETLRIELPSFSRNRTGQKISVIAECDATHIKSLIIQQDNYDRYIPGYSSDRLVIIPETISRLIAVETIKIHACITELPVALSKLNNLKLLDLTGCYNLLSIPEEILEMKDMNIRIGESISRASEVVFITVPSIGIITEVFSAIRTAKEKKIEQLIIHQMTPIFSYDRQEGFELPDEIKELHELKLLSITGNVSSLPSWIGNMSTLRSLAVINSRLRYLPSGIGNLSNLTSLNLSECSNLVSLPESIGNLSKLTTLNVTCHEPYVAMPLRELPKSVGNLSNLTSLDLTRCSNLNCFPSSMQNLPHLTNVKLTECYFMSLPSGIEYLKEVTELDLRGSYKLISLPDSIMNLSKLTSLDLSCCYKLVSLPSSIGTLSNLTSLNLSLCENLVSLPDSMANLIELQSLVLAGKLRSVPLWVCELKKLTSLSFSECYHLVSLPSSIGNLSILTFLYLRGCTGLASLPDSIGNLSKLTTITLALSSYESVRGMALRELPESIGALSNLTSLNLSGCWHLVSLPESIGNLSKLTSLTISSHDPFYRFLNQ